jgi:hypothetical protein
MAIGNRSGYGGAVAKASMEPRRPSAALPVGRRSRPSTDDPLVAKAFDAGQHEELARAVEQLSPEEARFFLHKLETALRKRKIQLMGYLVAMLVWVLGMVCALAYFGMADGFVGWVFLVPFGVVGVILYVFGMWANKVGSAPPRLGYDVKP